MIRVNGVLSEPFRVGRGVLEGHVPSPIFFKIGLEHIFRCADELNSKILLGVNIRDVTLDKVGFADDVILLASGVERAFTTVQNVQKSSGKGGLYVSVRKLFAQHIGRCSEAPAVTPKDIASLKLTRECPKPWCTIRHHEGSTISCLVACEVRRWGD